MAIARPPITEEEFMRLPGDGRKFEMVAGEAIEVPTYIRHDAIVVLITYLIYPSTRGRGALVGSMAGFRMRNGNIRCPDLSFTRKERLPNGKAPNTFGETAPDLCIEIISSTEDPRETDRKVVEYFDSGAVIVWHLFPDTKVARVFRSPDIYIILGPEDDITGGEVLPDFKCCVSDLFEIEE